EQRKETAALVRVRLGGGNVEQILKWFLNRRQVAPAKDRFDRRNHVSGFGYGRCALFEKSVGTFAAGIEWRAWHREDLAPLVARKPCSDQRARTACRLNDHDTE